jgi:tetratricopeptide (TPR) repeat protein
MLLGRWQSRGIWPALLLVNLLLLPFACEGFHFGDTDTFYHLASGRWMAQHGRILDHEAFSFTIEGTPWTNYYWLFQLLIYGAWSLAGLAGVIGLRAILILTTASVLILFLGACAKGERVASLAVSLLALTLFLSRALNVRPYLFSGLLLLLLLVRLERLRAGRGFFDPLLVLICAAWANLHGVEYVIALATTAIYAAAGLWVHRHENPLAALRSRSAQRWLLAVVACLAGFLINPFGARLLATAAIGLDQEVLAHMSEMQRMDWLSLGYLTPDFELTSQAPFNYLLLLGLALVPRWLRHRDLRALGLFALAVALAFERQRFRLEFGMLVATLVATEVGRLHEAADASLRWVRRGAAVLVVYLVAAVVVTTAAHFGRGFFAPLHPGYYPIGATRFLARHNLGGNLFCFPGYSGYVEWELFPAVRVFMDMRTPEPFGARWYWMSRALGRELPLETLERDWRVDLLLLERSHALARPLLAGAQPRWKPVYADTDFMVFAHERLLSGREQLVLRWPSGTDALGPLEREAAQREAERLIEDWPGNALAQETLMRLALAEGRAGWVRDQAALLDHSYPMNALFPYYEGVARRDLGDFDGAVGRLRASLARDPEQVRVATALVWTLLDRGQTRAAAAEAEALAERQRWHLDGAGYSLLGLTRNRSGDKARSADAYARALLLLPEQHPLRADVENDLAIMQLARGDPRGALALLDAAIKHRPAFPEAQLNRALALRQAGQAQTARAILDGLANDLTIPAAIRAQAQRAAQRAD